MTFNKQDRECVVTLSEAKGLARWAQRCFASLSMTGLVLAVKILYRAGAPKAVGARHVPTPSAMNGAATPAPGSSKCARERGREGPQTFLACQILNEPDITGRVDIDTYTDTT
jgi:hypothetical protein